MNLNSKTLAAALIAIFFGGILISSALGLWQTESTKEPIKFTEGEFAGQSNPADIRGSYTFGDIANAFGVASEILAQAFGITSDASSFQVKSLEEVYADSEYEIGTASVRLFVAFYAGLPYDLAVAEETYLPKNAAEILIAKGNLTAERIAFVESHTIAGGDPSAPAAEPTPQAIPSAEATPHAIPVSEEYVIKGKTTFGELIGWGVSQSVIESIIAAPMPDPAQKIKDYCAANRLDFETIKPALQLEVDKVKP
jgi:hypothetical protein